MDIYAKSSENRVNPVWYNLTKNREIVWISYDLKSSRAKCPIRVLRTSPVHRLIDLWSIMLCMRRKEQIIANTYYSDILSYKSSSPEVNRLSRISITPICYHI